MWNEHKIVSNVITDINNLDYFYRTSLLTLWTPEDGIPTLRKLLYAAGLRYTVQTARYHTRRKTVYLRYGA